MTDYIPREAVLEFVEPDARPFLAERIKSIPAADVRPVVKARWVYTDMSRLVCSNCGNPVAFALKMTAGIMVTTAPTAGLT